MKHLLNNLSEEEKNNIRKLHSGGMKVVNENFSKLVNYKSGNVESIIKEATPPQKTGHVSLLELVTKYRDSFMGFFNHIDASANEENFCENPKKNAEESMNILNDLIVRMASDNKTTPEGIIDDLYKKFNSGLGKMIIDIASPIIKKQTEGAEQTISKEVVDIIFSDIRQKYGEKGSLLVSVINEVFSKLNVKPAPFCLKQTA